MAMERKHYPWIWIVVGLIGLPILYLASFIPLSYAANHHILFVNGTRSGYVLEIYATPAVYLYEKGPQCVHDLLRPYDQFLGSL